MRRLLLTLLSLPLLLQACGGGHDTSGALPLGTHKVSVSPRCTTTQINNRFPEGGEVYNLTCGDTNVTIRNEELLVNGKSYGKLDEGDAVHVEAGGVLVNGKRRE
jgi:hypothetical protein